MVRCFDQRGAAGPAADHLGRQRGPVTGVLRSVRSPGGGVHELPEALDVLFELTEDQVAAVAAEVDRAAPGRVGQQQAPGIFGRRQQRPVGQLAARVRVAQDELAGGHGPHRLGGLRQPGDDGLRDAVMEAERLCVAEFACRELGGSGNAALLELLPEFGLPALEQPRVGGVEHQEAVGRRPVRPAPYPAARVGFFRVAQEPAPVRIGHALAELGREPGHDVVRQSQLAQAGRGERDLEGDVSGERRRGRNAREQPLEQRAAGRRLADGEDGEPGVPVLAVPAGEQALDVAEVKTYSHHCLTSARAIARRPRGSYRPAGPPGSGRCSRC